MRRIRTDRGQATVEFVLLFPFAMLLFLFLIEFGFVMYEDITVNNSAREAARFAAVAHLPNATVGVCNPGDYLSIEERAVEASSNVLTCDEITVGYIELNGDGLLSRGDAVVVEITHEYTGKTGLTELASVFSFGLIPTSFTMYACSDARLEAPLNPQPVQPPVEECGS